jgi:hypothetical protein
MKVIYATVLNSHISIKKKIPSFILWLFSVRSHGYRGSIGHSFLFDQFLHSLVIVSCLSREGENIWKRIKYCVNIPFLDILCYTLFDC